MAETSVEVLRDELYGLPLDEFTAARNAAAAALRKEGRRPEADELKALPKPNAAAWALNQLSRRNERLLTAFLKAAAALRDAQFAGRGDLKAATAKQRAALNELLGEAEAELGPSASKENVARVRQSLEAAAVDDDAAAALRSGRLAKELEPAGFGSLLAHAPAAPAGRSAAPAKPKPDAAAIARARRAVERAQQRLERAKRERDRIRESLAAAEEAVSEAAAEAERTATALKEAERA